MRVAFCFLDGDYLRFLGVARNLSFASLFPTNEQRNLSDTRKATQENYVVGVNREYISNGSKMSSIYTSLFTRISN